MRLWAKFFSRSDIERFRESRDTESLVEALRRAKDSRVRAKAAHALCAVRDSGAVEPLIDALQDEDEWVRSVAARSLGRLGDRRAVDPLTPP